MRLLVRTWNLFHGRSVPETWQTHLEEMVGLIAEGEPDVVCLQELPVWALSDLAKWSGMTAIGAVTMPPLGGPLARPLTALHPQLLRSGLTGQANAMLVARSPRVQGHPLTLPLNPRSVRRREATRQRLPAATRLAWARNRRVAQIVRLAADDVTVVLVNLHLSSLPDSRPADAELLRAVTFAESFATPGEPIVLAGDLNLTAAGSLTLRALRGWGYSEPAEGIDHVLVRGLALARGPQAWPAERRRRGGVLLSDHAPVDAEMIGP